MSYDRSKQRLKELKIEYSGCNNDLKIFIKKCIPYFQQAPPREKAKKFNPIKTSKPKELIQFDTVHIDRKFGDKKYISCNWSLFEIWLGIFDWKINSEYTRKCFEIVHKDCDFEIGNVHTDNGTGFKKYFEQYLTQNNINRKLGAPYKPTSQGAVEDLIERYKIYFIKLIYLEAS